MKRFILAVLLAFDSALPLRAQTAQASWGPVSGAATYTLYWGLNSGTNSPAWNTTSPATPGIYLNSLTTTNTSVTITSGLTTGAPTFFSITAQTASGLSSPYSPEYVVTFSTAIPETPNGLRVIQMTP